MVFCAASLKIGYMCRYCDSLPEYCEQFRLYRLQVVQANGSRQGTPFYNRPCIIGACAYPSKTDCTRKDNRKCQNYKCMEVIPWRKRKSKCFTNFWNVQKKNETQKRRQLCGGRYSNLKTDRRRKSAFFACFSFLRWLLWIYLYNRKCETINAIQVRPYMTGLDNL